MSSRMLGTLIGFSFCLGLTLAASTQAQLSAAGNMVIQQGQDAVQGGRQEDDFFGSVLAWGDFNGDGFDDLALGVPDEDVFVDDEGSVQVLYGTSDGLTSFADQEFWRILISGAGPTHPGDRMGHALASADFDGDGFADLAIGIPGDEVGGADLAGSVVVLYGSLQGLDRLVAQSWNQDVAGVAGGAEVGDSCGATLAVGDFDDDGFADLVVGCPSEALGNVVGAGAAHVLFGSATGLDGVSRVVSITEELFHSDPAISDRFAGALAVGDFDGDDFDDLVVGVPGDDVASTNGGAVFFLFGSAAGIEVDGSFSWPYLRTDFRCGPGEPFEPSEADDRFGAALAAADLDGDGRDDLVVGIPGASVRASSAAGQVDVLYASVDLFLSEIADCWNQDVPDLGSNSFPHHDEGFGAALAAGDITGDGFADLVIGTPGETFGPIASFGCIQVLHGSQARLAPAGEPYWNQRRIGAPNGIEAGDAFGAALALGDANGDGKADLAIGAPGEEVDPNQPNHGVAQVLYSIDSTLPFGDGFESGDLTAWSSSSHP